MNDLSFEIAALMCVPGMTNTLARKIFDSRGDMDNIEDWLSMRVSDADKARYTAENIISTNKAKGISIITVADDAFPEGWKNIKLKEDDNTEFNYAPLILFYRGNIDLLKTKSAAVVGNRNISNKAAAVITTATFNLIKDGYTIVSGLADGTDTVAHKTCLMYNGKTVAILGNDLGMEGWYWSKYKKNLAEKILDQDGLLISEYNIGTPPSKDTLVYRNRLQCCLADKTVVGAMSSIHCGTMHTVRYALANNKDTYAVIPDKNITYEFSGNKVLIKNYNVKPFIVKQ